MKTSFAPRLSLTLVLACVSFGATAAECLPVVENGWIRLPPVAMPMMAGFARIGNPCAGDVEVVSASSPLFADVSLHQSTNMDGVNRMREVESLPVAAGQSVELKPGGLHLMLMQPERMPAEGERVSIALKLKDGREVAAQWIVRKTQP